MKNILRVALLMALTMTTLQLSAQKSGRINSQAVVVAMPETTAMQTELEALRKDAAENLETMQVELNNKLVEYQNSAATMNDSIRAMKEKEMQDLNQRMQQFEQSATQELQVKQNQLIEPILTKVREAINSVAEAGGYEVVYDEAAGGVAYFSPTLVVDITNDVKAKLGIQ
ncbi:MAG: OmpH family outer membrane protein [Rikenellaceae bacterium]